jgi:hypothetical protein
MDEKTRELNRLEHDYKEIESHAYSAKQQLYRLQREIEELEAQAQVESGDYNVAEFEEAKRVSNCLFTS